MGGGDLNMKKHFHPLTMQNLERVWKAEQKAKEEAEKLEQLQRELEEERRREALQQHAVDQGIIKKRNEKLDWMYAGPQVNHEEYLLGRKIDKNVEILKEEEDKPIENAGATFIPEISNPVKDMAAKIKEDPLFLIRKKEEESKKELVQNPIKLRKLKEMLNLSVKDKKKNKKSKKSKYKKDKKERKRRYESDSESEEDNKEDHRSKKRKEKEYFIAENGHDVEKRQKNRGHEREKRRRRERSDASDSNDNRHRYSSEGWRGGNRRDDARKGKKEDNYNEDAMERRIIQKRETERRDTNERRNRMRETEKREERMSGRDKEVRSKNIVYNSRREESDKKRQQRRRSSSEEESDSSEDDRGRSRTDSYANGHSRGTKSGESREECSYGLIHPKAKSERESKHKKTLEGSEDDSRPGRNGIRKNQIRDGRSKVRHRHDSSSDSSPERHQANKKGWANGGQSSSYERSRDRREVKKANSPPSRMISKNLSRKLTEEELERKRQEMMDNAKWRDDQRGKNIQKYKKEEENEAQEEKRRAISPDSKAKFIHELQVKSYSSAQTASVEDRIKRNIYTKQRTRDALSKKFTEK